jgi:AcrR family transcriptional regulator
MVTTDLDGRQRRAAERREETRERLLAAALEVFAEQGYHAGTTKTITQRAGVADGLLFHYFPTKADLMAAVAERSPISNEMRRLIAEAADQPVAVALPAIARGWFQTLRESRALVRVLFEQAHADPRVHAALLAHREREAALLASFLAERVATLELRPIEPRLAADMLFQAVFGLVMLCGKVHEGDDEQLLDGQIDLLLHGMLRPAPNAATPANAEPRQGREDD